MNTVESRTGARGSPTEPITVVGAGPAGLASAIALARAGRSVVVREWHRQVGTRFHGDFQGLENWSDELDVLDELRAAGIEIAFDHRPVFEGSAFDAQGNRYQLQSKRPLYYLVRRGRDNGTLDSALLGQAKSGRGHDPSGRSCRYDHRPRCARRFPGRGPRGLRALIK
jgi:2-polyprenyl-6-methoxyphenol hydroxylase-like FAD-dependent oxidoreductase